MASWDDEYAAFMGSAGAGPSEEESFIDRARAAPDDDDDDIAMGEDPIRLGPAPRNGNRARIAVLGQDVAEETALQQLIRHWMNERHAPDILPGQELLLGRILDHVRKQVSLAFCQRELLLWLRPEWNRGLRARYMSITTLGEPSPSRKGVRSRHT